MNLSTALSINSISRSSGYNTAPISTIYDGPLLSSNGWVATSPNGLFTQSGSDQIMSGTGGTGGSSASNLFQDYWVFDSGPFSVTCLEQWKITVDFTTGTLGGATYGFSAGVRSINTFEHNDTGVRISQASGDEGNVFRYVNDTSSTGTANQRSVSSSYNFQDSTNYKIQVERDELTLYGRVLVNDSIVHEESITDPLSTMTGTSQPHNTGKFCIWQHGGTSTVHNVKIESDALRYPKIAFMGDSILLGGKATSLSDRWVNEYATSQFTSMGGWGDRMTELYERRAEVAYINPEYIFIAAGSNDIKDTSWTSTGNGKLDDLITYFGANTRSQIILVNASARNDVDVTQVKTDMDTKGLSVVDAFTETKQPANTNLLGAYNSGDGVHLTDAGHTAISTEAINEVPNAR